MPLLDSKKRQELVKSIAQIEQKKTQADELIATISHILVKNDKIDRTKFSLLPVEVGSELVMYWLKQHGFREFDKKTVVRIGIAIKTALPGTKHNVRGSLWLLLDNKTARLIESKASALERQ
jgi:hypothetical protein